MPIKTNWKDIEDAQRFTGVLVESVERISRDGQERWYWAIYNVDTGAFVYDSVKNLDPTKRGWAQSGIAKRLVAARKLGINGDLAAFEGHQCEFSVVYDTFGTVTVARTIPTAYKGRVSTTELATLKASLVKVRAEAEAKYGEASHTPTEAALDDDTVEALLELYDGATEEEAQATALRGGFSVDIRNAVVTGDGLRVLMGQGRLTLDDGGRFARE